jgi:hypothetical protein
MRAKKCLLFVKDGCNLRAHSKPLPLFPFFEISPNLTELLNFSMYSIPRSAQSLDTSRPQRDDDARASVDKRQACFGRNCPERLHSGND